MAAQMLYKAIPNLDFAVANYVNSLFSSSDADPADQPVESFIRPLLEGEAVNPVPRDEIERICTELAAQWRALTGTEDGGAGNSAAAPAKLDVALDMRRQELKSKRQTVTHVVDIASVVRTPSFPPSS